MKKLLSLLSAAIVLTGTSLIAEIEIPNNMYNATKDIPLMSNNVNKSTWRKYDNVAQYKEADWSQCIGMESHVTVAEAMRIADSNPDITYFFYVKGGRMVLENYNENPPIYRIFHHGDAVFFSGTPWWGNAPGLADGYMRD